MVVFDLRILRLSLEIRSGRPIQVYVKESVNEMFGHGDLAATVDSHDAKRVQHVHHQWTPQYRVVTEHVMIRTSDRDSHPAVARQPVEKGAEVGSGQARFLVIGIASRLAVRQASTLYRSSNVLEA